MDKKESENYSDKIDYVAAMLGVDESDKGEAHRDGINIAGRMELMDVFVAMARKIEVLESRLSALETGKAQVLSNTMN
jgi:hypothetical protein